MNELEKSKRELARKLLDSSLKRDRLEMFLRGDSLFQITEKDSSGRERQSPRLVMNAIYEKYQQDSSLKLDNKVTETMIDSLKRIKNGGAVINYLNLIEYQMMNEKNNLAPFKLDCESLLREVSSNIIRNKELYQSPNQHSVIKDHYGIDDLWKMFEDHDKNIETHYGQRIL